MARKNTTLQEEESRKEASRDEKETSHYKKEFIFERNLDVEGRIRHRSTNCKMFKLTYTLNEINTILLAKNLSITKI